MAVYNPRSFTNPRALKHIDPTLLLSLLSKFADYFRERNIQLQRPIDYDSLADILASPTLETPEELSDALYFIHEMATDAGIAALQKEVESQNLRILTPGEVSNADFAILVYLEDPRLLEKVHAELTLTKRRSFEHFKAFPGLPSFKPPARSIISRLERDFSQYFEDKLRGPFARVSVVAREDETWFFIRHGKTFQREGRIEGDKSSPIYFRPEQYDTTVYNKARNELRVNGSSQWVDLYRQRFGHHLFNKTEYFCDESKFTLEPLRRDGELSLVSADVIGIESVKLTEISYLWPGSDPETETHKAKDLFANLKARSGHLPEKAKLIEAKFLVTFTRFKRKRTVAIRPPNTAQYVRDEDGPLAEEWMQKRGFVVGE